MKQPITIDRWLQAQKGEKEHHEADTVDNSYEHYKKAYEYYFKYLGMDKDLDGRSVVEIGPGRIAGLLFCKNYGNSYVLEPTEYDGIAHLYAHKPNLTRIGRRAEDWVFPNVDEVWLFNVLQHVQDPDILIAKCKEASKVIRFFEPVDLPTNLEHPFTFSVEDFRRYFGDCVNEYEAGQGIEGFHGAKCAYGTYICK